MARFSQGSGSVGNDATALNYVQVAGTQQIISSAPNSFIDLDITTTGAPVQISVTGEGNNAAAGSWARINLFRDNVAIGNEIQIEASAISENVPFAINFIDDVAAGTYNYSARVTTIAGGNWTFGEVDGPVMNAVELTGFKGDDGADGTNGTNGTNGADGADALWSFEGEWQNGIDYAPGSVVQLEGSSYYHPDGQFSSYAPPGYGWLLVSAKGADGADGADGEDAETVSETSFTVNGGSLGTMPTFDGDPLFSGTYVKTGPLVHFQIQVDMDNITNFGTGQYYVDLPFPAKYSYHFRDACLHDNSGTVRQYALSGHVYAGQSQVTLWFTSTSGQDELFDYNSPALLTVSDNFHISGTYIAE